MNQILKMYDNMDIRLKWRLFNLAAWARIYKVEND